MLKYIHADLHRIYRRVPRYIMLAVFYLAMFGYLVYTIAANNLNEIGVVNSCSSVFVIAVLLFGELEMLSVFADDFRAKTMQIAIGGGVSRPCIVLAKLLEFAALALGDLVFLAVGITVCSAATGNPLQGAQLYQVFIYIFGYMMNMLIPVALTMIPVFYTQSTGLAAIIYLIFFVDPAAQIISFAFPTNEIVLRLHLNEIPFSSLVGVVNTQLGLQASFPLGQIIGLFAYVIAACALAIFAFRNRELEF